MGREKANKPKKPKKQTNGPRTQGVTVAAVVRHLEAQRTEANRRGEPEVATNYFEESAMNAAMAEKVITPGLGAVPSDVMKQALRQIGF